MQRVPEVIHAVQVAELASAVAHGCAAPSCPRRVRGGCRAPGRPTPGSPSSCPRTSRPRRGRRTAPRGAPASHRPGPRADRCRGRGACARPPCPPEPHLEVEPAHAERRLVLVTRRQRLVHRLSVSADRLVHVDLARAPGQLRALAQQQGPVRIVRGCELQRAAVVRGGLGDIDRRLPLAGEQQEPAGVVAGATGRRRAAPAAIARARAPRSCGGRATRPDPPAGRPRSPPASVRRRGDASRGPPAGSGRTRRRGSIRG